PFELQFPTEMEDWLEDSNCKTVRFNPFGTMLAIAGTEGRCSILDFDTRSVLRDLRGHQATVTSVSWSKNGRYLLSTGSDGQCVYWDLLPGEACHEFAVDSGAVLTGVAHPRNSHLFAVCPQAETPFLVDIRDGQLRRIPLNLVYTPASPGEYTKFAKINDCALDDQRVDLGKHAFATLNFDRSGKRLFLGTTKGLLIIYHLRKAVVETVLSITNSSIRHIRFSRRGTDLLVNSADRSIRLYIYDSGDKQRRVLKRNYRQLQRAQVKAEVDGQQSAEEVAESLRHTGPTLTFIHKYLDQVNRVQWNECCFTSDGEHVIGGSAHKAEHNIYVWDKNATNLEKMLTGPREQLLDLTWHPFRPIAVSVSVFGNIYIWGGKHREDWRNWNAFAPDFKELEQNV
ncbi:chromatin binding protein, partial [Tieghemiomyces parasiticus]